LPPPAPAVQAAIDAARLTLGDARADEALATGRDLSREQAIALARDGRPREAALATHAESVLTRREREVAALLARGYSNREIASTLVVGERTAEMHVSNILAKLGLTSRAQVAVWAASVGSESL
jgi:non-specific serine/threonine protein kinase